METDEGFGTIATLKEIKSPPVLLPQQIDGNERYNCYPSDVSSSMPLK